jgi:RNA polymerase sigma factor (sigma-70 family)
MATYSLHDFIRRLCRARSVAEDGQLTDAQLLQRFAQKRDEAAFEVLVWRHGALVLNVARRLLRDATDTEDVFQATFLTLARKASAIRRGTAVGSWLYKVAYRLALKVRRSAARQRQRQSANVEAAAPPQPAEDDELTVVLTEEVSRLPERYRAAVVLCYLQGATTEQAARVLGCPRGTVLSRLSSARQRLRRRLVRRGIAPVIAASAVTFAEVASATPSAELVASVVGAALSFAAGRAAIPMVSPQAAALAQGALQAMLWNKIKITVAMLCVMALTGSGVGWLTRQRAGVEAAPPNAAEPQVKKELPLPSDAANREEMLKKEVKKIQARMDFLAEQEAKQEERWFLEIIEARRRLTSLQEELRLREQEWSFAHEAREARLKSMVKEVSSLEDKRRDIAIKGDSDLGKRIASQLQQLNNTMYDLQDLIIKHAREHSQTLEPIRVKVLQAEESLRRIRLRQAQQREDSIARRQALQSRIERLEEASLHLPPADRLQDVERKLDALRRDVNELRRTRER